MRRTRLSGYDGETSSGVGIMVVRIAKLVVLLLFAAAVGFLFGLLRPRRVTSRTDIANTMSGRQAGGDGIDVSDS